MADRRPSRDRKRTPDVLAELLSADLPPIEPVMDASTVALLAAPSPAPRARPEPRAPQEAKPGAAVQQGRAAQAWEVEIVSFQEHRGWRPRYINGAEVEHWLTGSPVEDYVNQRGAEGWELAGASTAPRFYGVADSLQLYFKRPK